MCPDKLCTGWPKKLPVTCCIIFRHQFMVLSVFLLCYSFLLPVVFPINLKHFTVPYTPYKITSNCNYTISNDSTTPNITSLARCNKKAELPQRRPCYAPNKWVPGKFWESWPAHGYFSQNLFNGLLFRLILRMCIQNWKFVASRSKNGINKNNKNWLCSVQTIPQLVHQTELATAGMHTVVSDLQQVTQYAEAADNDKS